MRLFIAINLDDNIRDALAEMQDSMRRQGVRGNYTKTENLHLTLAVIGEYSDLDALNEALASVPLEPFRLALRGYGSFGNLYWAGLEDSDKLSAYVKRLRRALAEQGIPFDRKFSPHITLVRQAPAGLPRLRVPSVSMEVRRVSLMRSERGKNGMIYTEIGFVESMC